MAVLLPLHRRERFDPSRDFVVARVRRLEGRDWAPGEPFDKSLVTEYRLKTMYELGHVAMAPLDPAGSGGPEVGAAGRVAAPAEPVEIPDGWDRWSWQRLRKLAGELAGRAVDDTAEARLIIASEEERRREPAGG
jgi:hypothetical protein